MSEKVNRRKFIGYGAAAVAAAAIAGTGAYYYLQQPAKKNEVKLGVLAPLTGSFTVYGNDQQENAQLVADKWNDKGGILGVPITNVVRDTESNPEAGTRRAKELISTDRVDFMTGTVSNATQYAVMEVVRDENVIWMVGSGTTAPLKMKDTLSRYAWYIYSDVQMFAKVDARYGIENIGSTAYILAMDYVWGRLVSDYYKATFEENGGKVVAQEYSPLGTTDFSAFLPRILDANPDVVVVPLGGNDLVTFIKQATSYGLKDKMKVQGINSPTLSDSVALPVEEMEDIVTGLQFYWEIPEAKAYVEEFMSRYDHPPDPWGYCVYAGLNELFSAIEKADSFDKDKIREELEKPHTWNWGKGDCYFRECDHQAIQPWHIVRGKSPDEITQKWDRFEILKKYAAEENEQYLPTCEELGY